MIINIVNYFRKFVTIYSDEMLISYDLESGISTHSLKKVIDKTFSKIPLLLPEPIMLSDIFISINTLNDKRIEVEIQVPISYKKDVIVRSIYDKNGDEIKNDLIEVTNKDKIIINKNNCPSNISIIRINGGKILGECGNINLKLTYIPTIDMTIFIDETTDIPRTLIILGEPTFEYNKKTNSVTIRGSGTVIQHTGEIELINEIISNLEDVRFNVFGLPDVYPTFTITNDYLITSYEKLSIKQIKEDDNSISIFFNNGKLIVNNNDTIEFWKNNNLLVLNTPYEKLEEYMNNIPNELRSTIRELVNVKV